MNKQKRSQWRCLGLARPSVRFYDLLTVLAQLGNLNLHLVYSPGHAGHRSESDQKSMQRCANDAVQVIPSLEGDAMALLKHGSRTKSPSRTWASRMAGKPIPHLLSWVQIEQDKPFWPSAGKSWVIQRDLRFQKVGEKGGGLRNLTLSRRRLV